jgi:hypothetical protein
MYTYEGPKQVQSLSTHLHTKKLLCRGILLRPLGMLLHTLQLAHLLSCEVYNTINRVHRVQIKLIKLLYVVALYYHVKVPHQSLLSLYITLHN